MSNTGGLFPLKRQPFAMQFLVSMSILAGIALVSELTIMLIVRLTIEYDFNSVINGEQPVTPEVVRSIKIIQAFQHMALFLMPSIVICWLMTFNIVKYLGLSHFPKPLVLFTVAIISLCILPINGLFGSWNSMMELPDWLSGVESWMQRKEMVAAKLTGIMLKADSPSSLWINILVLAVIPAIGEEVLFRGVLQKILSGWMRSGTLGVWITAIVFSFIHFQFYGFLPRMLLGLVYGYLFLWSSTIWLPILGHFLNNLISVVGAYFWGWETAIKQGNQIIDGGPLSILAPVVMFVFLMLSVRRWYLEKE